MDILFLLLGITALLIGTELAVGGALSIARKYHVSDFVVGLIVLSIGSDLPEVAVAIDAGFRSLLVEDASGVVVGTSIGSVIAQIGFVLGVAGLLKYLTLPRRYIVQHGAVLISATIVLMLIASDGRVTATEGLIMLTFYVVYLVLLLSREGVPHEAEDVPGSHARWPWPRLVVGLVIVILGSELTVNSAVALATAWNVSDAIISVLIIGLGTSLPELAISLSAIFKKKVHLSVGNIIGSNIFDTLVPISAAALITPVMFASEILWFDLPYALVLTVVVLFLFTRKHGLQRHEAGIILSLYALFIVIKLTQI